MVKLSNDLHEQDTLNLYLTKEQKEYLHRELHPRWDLDPPQREEYTSDHWYYKALAMYLQRCIETELLERLGTPK